MKTHHILYGLCLLLFLSENAVWAQTSDVEAADFNGSGTVDFPDFLTFAKGFGKSAGDADFDARLDLSGNGDVDFADFVIFARNFGRSTSEPAEVFLYIADLGGGQIRIIDVQSNLEDLSRAIRISQPRGIAFSAANRQIYVAGVDTFYVLTESGARVHRIPLVDPSFEPGGVSRIRGGYKVVLSPDHRFAFVTEEIAGTVAVVDLRPAGSDTAAIVARVPVSPAPRGIAIAPDGKEVYVAHGGRATALSIVDGVRHTYLDSLPVGDLVPTRLAMAPDGRRLYLNSASSGWITAVDLTSGALVDSVAVGQPGDLSVEIPDIAISEDGSRLYATANRIVPGFDPLGAPTFGFVGDLVIVDTTTFEKAGDGIEVGEVAANMGVSPDGKTAYVAGAKSLMGQPEPVLQVFIVDLENRTNLGFIGGFNLPVEFKFRAGKPVLLPAGLPEIVVF